MYPTNTGCQPRLPKTKGCISYRPKLVKFLATLLFDGTWQLIKLSLSPESLSIALLKYVFDAFLQDDFKMAEAAEKGKPLEFLRGSRKAGYCAWPIFCVFLKKLLNSCFIT